MAHKRDAEARDGVDVTSWISLCESLEEYYGDQYRVEKAKANVPPTWQYFNPSRFTTNGTQGGDQRLRAIRKALKFIDANGTKRSKHQVQMHDGFIAACIRNIYKSEFAANYMRILKDNAWDECCSEVLVCCPRRFGKTFAVGMFVAAYAMTQPNCKICIFSPGRRQSEMMLELVKDFVFKFPNGKSKIKKLNKENLWLKGDNDNDVRKIMAYPSKVETLKGVGGDIIIVRCRCRCRCVTFASPLLVLPAQCEEAAAMDMKGTWDFCARERDRRALVAGASVRFRGASDERRISHAEPEQQCRRARVDARRPRARRLRGGRRAPGLNSSVPSAASWCTARRTTSGPQRSWTWTWALSRPCPPTSVS